MKAHYKAARNNWRRLSVLLMSVERLMDAAARMDLLSNRGDGLSARLETLEKRMDRELDRVTAVRLRYDLESKQRGVINRWDRQQRQKARRAALRACA